MYLPLAIYTLKPFLVLFLRLIYDMTLTFPYQALRLLTNLT